jgi:STE24 endopeptidase
MNIYAKVVLVALLVEFAIQQCASYLSLFSILGKPAELFADVIDDERYRRLQCYIQARTYLHTASETFYLAVLLFFWFGGGFRWLGKWSADWGFGPLLTGLLVIAAIALGRVLVALPFSAYFTFRIEASFGFNNTTLQTFLTDLLKAALLSVAIGGPLLSAILTLLGHRGHYSWLYAWILVTAVFLFLQVIAPNLILPLFNKFEPLKNRQLLDVISSYAASVNFPLSAISVMDASSRSNKSNAFFTGFGSNHRLVLEDTLLNRHTVPELLAIVAHEVGHYKEKHIPLRITMTVLQLGVFFLTMSFFLNAEGLFQAFYVDLPSVYLGIVFFTLLYSPLAFAWSILLNWLARKQEYAADAFSADTTRQPRAMAEALRKLAVDNLSHLAPHHLDVVLNYSHPPLQNRVRALAAL